MNKIIKTYDFSKLKRNFKHLLKEEINVLGNHLNKAIQDNIDNSRDLNKSSFKRLSPVTKKLGGDKILERSGTMRKTKKIPATDKKLEFHIEMAGKSSRSGNYYGAYHNEGYVNPPGSWFPGTVVPARKWFGVPVDFKKGGKEYDKAILNIKLRIRRAFKK